MVSRGIRWFTRGEYSHATLLFDSDYAIEAVYPRVRAVYFKSVYKDLTKYKVFEVVTTDEQHKAILAYSAAQINKPYDWVGDLHFVTRQDYANQPDNKWFCSELVFESFKQAGVELFKNTEGWQVDPDMLKRTTLAK